MIRRAQKSLAKLHFSVGYIRHPCVTSLRRGDCNQRTHTVRRSWRKLREIHRVLKHMRPSRRPPVIAGTRFRQGRGIFVIGGLSSPQQVDERGILALPAAKRLGGAEKRCSEVSFPPTMQESVKTGGVICHSLKTPASRRLAGKIIVAMMNLGHSPVAQWGFALELAPDARVLDCGCGG